MTGQAMAGGGLAQPRVFGRAARLGVRAAGVETAAGRRIERARNVALQRDTLGAQGGGGLGNRRQQRMGVGMQRSGVDGLFVGDLDQLTELHHRHAVADVLYDGKIMGNEQIGESEALLQILQQVDDLRLDRHVERRHRLVADDQVGIDPQRTGDAAALRYPPENWCG
jgi:hypothetical protein